MTVREAAALLQCSTSFVYKLMRTGELAFDRRGRRTFPLDESVAEYRRRNEPERVNPGESYGYSRCDGYRGTNPEPWDLEKWLLKSDVDFYRSRIRRLAEEVATLRSEQTRRSAAGGGGRRNAEAEGPDEPPREVSTAEAARLLGVTKDTVLKLKAEGLLEYRNTAPPGSSRPVYAFTFRSVMELRTGYQRDQPTPPGPTGRRRGGATGRRAYKHLDLGD